MDADSHAGQNAANNKDATVPEKSSQMDGGLAKPKHAHPGKKERAFKPMEFIDLYRKESAKMGRPVDMDKNWISTGAGGEPWVNFTPQDRFGLALSGGGIRSATFNLGLLQALDQLRVLKHVDYLATVSGGGYVGGFWTAWLLRNTPKPDPAEPDEKMFPIADEPGGGESAEVRHLREFSRFLLPRVRVVGTEFWGIVMTVLGGLLPSLTAAPLSATSA